MSAPEKATEIKAGITAIIAFFTALWGWTGWAIIVWLICIILDYAAGSLAAKKDNNWSSAIAREGLWHKLGEIFAVLVAALTDIALQVIVAGSGITIPFEIGPLITPVVLLWYTLTEIGSIIENCGKLGAPVPSWFKQYVDKSKAAIDKEKEAPPEDEKEKTESPEIYPEDP